MLQKDVRKTKRVPVRVRAVFVPPPTYDFFDEHRLVPDSVAVTGASSVVDTVTAWPTIATEHSGFQDTLEVTLPLEDTPSGLDDLEKSEIKVFARRPTNLLRRRAFYRCKSRTSQLLSRRRLS